MVLDSVRVVENYYNKPTTFNQKAMSSFKLNIGNSAAVNLTLNDNPLQFAKVKKKSIRVFVDKNGLKVLNSER